MLTRPIALLILMVCAAYFVSYAQMRGPEYQHKSIVQWLEVYDAASPGSARQKEAADAVRHCGPYVPAYLAGMLWNEDYRTQALGVRGFEILGPAGAPAIPALTNLFYDTNDLGAIHAASSLANIGMPALPFLLDALKCPRYRVSLDAALVIVDLGTNAAPAIPIFLHDLKSPDWHVRARAADALGKLHLQPETVVPALTNAFGDLHPDVQCLAIRSAGRFQSAARPAVPLLLAVLEDPDPDVREVATNAILEIDPAALKTSGK